MKEFIRIFWGFILAVIFSQPVMALDEIVLDIKDPIKMEIRDTNLEITNPDIIQEDNKTFKAKIQNIFETEVTDNEHVKYLLDDVLTKKIEKGPLETIGIRGMWRGALTENFFRHDNDTSVSYDELETRLHGEFRNKKTSFVIGTRFLPQHEFNFFQYLISDAYIKHRYNKHNSILIGNSRTHTGQEGAQSERLIPFYSRSQISNQFGNIRKLGVRAQGDYSLMEYDIAVNSTGTYFTSFFPGAEFCGWINFKPLGKTNGRFGDLKIGGGLTSGRRHFNYNVVGGYVKYKYKKLGADFEIANGDGYNGRRGFANVHARGFYTTLYYDLTKKVQLLARYDDFTPNCNDSSYRTKEYSAGINYFIKGQALKLILNYVYRQDSLNGDSHRIILGTQIAI